MTRAVGNGMIQTLANAIGTGAVGKLAKQVAGLSTDMANIKSPEKGSGLMFNPNTGKLYIPCGNGVTVNKNTGMLEVPIGDNLRYTGSGLDVPDADETTAGVVKLTHEVSNRDDGEWAITADGVYAYAPGYKTVPVDIRPMCQVTTGVLASCSVAGNSLFINAYDMGPYADNGVLAEISGYKSSVAFIYGVALKGVVDQIRLENTASGFKIHALTSYDGSVSKLSAVIPVYKL